MVAIASLLSVPVSIETTGLMAARRASVMITAILRGGWRSYDEDRDTLLFSAMEALVQTMKPSVDTIPFHSFMARTRLTYNLSSPRRIGKRMSVLITYTRASE
jgi:hypothetical protein